ncbi:hypothetical protein [Marinobacter subterrani]|uniref:hypothetical protein n=1 Tax=Marinobacter subterrani TaxID=1658765 RepID=UPI0023544497|nr:hypothetical protein [Marinobacter subterrani]
MQWLLMLPAAVLLSGCGLDITNDATTTEAQSPSVTEPTVHIAGAAVKGVIQQGLVVANRLIADNQGNYAPQRQAAKPVRTAEDGSYEWQLRGKAEGWALVELSADSSTRMICDVVPQCDQAGSAPVAFGQPMALDSDFRLRGAGDLSMETVNLTPLTHLAVALAERSGNGLSPGALAGAYTTVEEWFGLPAGALRLTPPDLSRLDAMTSVSADAIQVAIANAAFLALVNSDTRWSSISDVLNNLTAQVSAAGQISVVGDATNIALADVVSAAALQASELQATTDSSIISQKLAVVESRNVQRFKTIADVNTDSTTGTVGAIETTQPPVTETAPAETIPADAALLSWTAPLTRENGDSLAMGEIAGFEVVYGASADTLDQSIAIGDASVDQLLVDGLTQGTWYFAIRTLDTAGNRSRLSEVVYKQI